MEEKETTGSQDCRCRTLSLSLWHADQTGVHSHVILILKRNQELRAWVCSVKFFGGKNGH